MRKHPGSKVHGHHCGICAPEPKSLVSRARMAATTGQIQSTPSALPGSLTVNSGYLGTYAFQFAVTTGALPATAATPAAGAAWTGGVPAYWLDSADV